MKQSVRHEDTWRVNEDSRKMGVCNLITLSGFVCLAAVLCVVSPAEWSIAQTKQDVVVWPHFASLGTQPVAPLESQHVRGTTYSPSPEEVCVWDDAISDDGHMEEGLILAQRFRLLDLDGDGVLQPFELQEHEVFFTDDLNQDDSIQWWEFRLAEGFPDEDDLEFFDGSVDDAAPDL